MGQRKKHRTIWKAEQKARRIKVSQAKNLRAAKAAKAEAASPKKEKQAA
jgi:hypothetical protein